VMIVPWYHIFDYLNCLWNFGKVIFKRNVVKIEVKDVPITGVCAETTNFVFRNVLIGISWTPIWLKAFLISKSNEFFSNHSDLLLQF